ERFVTALDSLRLRIIPIVSEPANPVVQAALEKAGGDHHAGIARWSQVGGAQLAIDEIVLAHSDQLIEPERDFEATHLHLSVPDVPNVHEHVFPHLFWRQPREHFPLSQLVFLQLALDFVFDLFEKVALDANAATMQLPHTARRKQGVVVASQGALGALVGIVRVHLKLGLEIHAEWRCGARTPGRPVRPRRNRTRPPETWPGNPCGMPIRIESTDAASRRSESRADRSRWAGRDPPSHPAPVRRPSAFCSSSVSASWSLRPPAQGGNSPRRNRGQDR